MPQTTKNKNSSFLNSQKEFVGFQPPTSNTTYTPNQYFDVCMPNYSRGVVRLVGYMLRKTLGWCDVNGKPQETIIPISYENIIKEANISRRALKQAIEEAVKGNFVRFVRIPKPKRRGKNFVTGLLEIKWDEKGRYTTDLKEFKGFFAGEGNRTYIPNEFFDVTVKLELLRISKVVGTIIRNSIGYANKYGHRRKHVQLSISEIAYYSKLCNEKVNEAIKEAVKKSYICVVEKGFIDFSNSSNSRKSIYCLNWCDNTTYSNNGAKKQASQNNDQGKKASEEIEITEQKSKRVPKNIVAKKQAKHKQKGNRNIGKKATDLYKQIQPLNTTFKQHPLSVDVKKSITKLKKIGFKKSVALEISKYHLSNKILSIVTNQIDWLSNRKIEENKLGFLRQAIKNNYSKPEDQHNESNKKNNGKIFARSFYAGYSGIKGETTTEPSGKEIEIAEKYVNRLIGKCSNKKENQAENFGRLFAEMFKSKLSGKTPIYISLAPALRSHGDEFYMNQEREVKKDLEKEKRLTKEKYHEKYQPGYEEYLRNTEESFKLNRREDYDLFLKKREEEKEAIIHDEYMSETIKKGCIEDLEIKRIFAFQEYFSKEILDFWGWDRSLNAVKLDLIKLR